MSTQEHTNGAAHVIDVERAHEPNAEHKVSKPAMDRAHAHNETMTDTASTAGSEDSDGGISIGQAGLKNLVIDDAQRAIPVQTDANGLYRGPHSAERNGRSFVEGAFDDPFQSSPSKHTRVSPTSGNGATLGESSNSGMQHGTHRLGSSSVHGTPSGHRHPAYLQTNWRSGRSSSDGSAAPQAVDASRVSSQNAQAVYPPSACVFVANLLQNEDERELEYSVTRIFSRFGPVWVKIRRDPKGMPYAFCQYTCDEDAQRAITHGRGLLIHGRPCRTERAKANRTFLIARRFGKDLTLEEARDLCTEFGKIERTWIPSETDLLVFGLPRGVFVTFLLYESGKGAMNGFRDHPDYTLTAINPQGSSPIAGPRPNTVHESHHVEQWMHSYDDFRASIFVGNLPDFTTEFTIKDLFREYGQIMNIDIQRRQSTRSGQGLNVFAFVEFDHPIAASRAVREKHNYEFGGVPLKVTGKNPPEYNRGGRFAHGEPQRRRSTTYRSPEYRRHSGISPPMYGPYAYGHPTTPMSHGGHSGFAPTQYPAPYSYWMTSPTYSATPGSGDHASAAAFWAGYGYGGYPYQYYGVPTAGYAGYQPSPTGYYPGAYAEPQIPEERAGTPTPVAQAEDQDVAEPTLQ